ncbi:endonuclease/exonuclease/phosphatase family protein [Campylobacter vicugnae]|uniref:endonuclease/exonuclease/phosphatase family protein n=1 Tax=Campylobacter vicugnae TaxID=1660076 RepID=UPI00254CCDDA|nr:endonuclease/exonuclease/phosphatase family protein [Campylobacter ovis]MDL0104835.1 endonuclease/exonuclease/phosphatase family protein [Campylobacter ovis]MDL0105987.1 endonuclease/exonuclease/phosphatase family protein [Campylobacter ovis]
MRVLVALIFLFSLLFSSELKIATYNVENLFDDKISGSEYSDFKSNRWNSAKYQQKLRKISRVLRELNADVVALNEIENENVIKELANLSGYKFYKFATLKGSPIGLGLLSRYRISDSEIYVVPDVKTRPILMSRVEFEGHSIEFFIAHFPAAKNPLKHRIAAANTMKKAVKNSKNGVILGDLNSNYGYKFLLNGLDGWTNLWEFLPSYQRSSYKNGKSAIDHIILSKDLMGKNLHYKDGSFGVFKANFMDDSYSDHYPLYATLSLQEDIKDVPSKLISQIKSVNSNRAKITGVVMYKDKNGYILADESRRGIYVYEKNPTLILGTKVEAVVNRVEDYKGNIEITSLSYIAVDTDFKGDESKYLLDKNDINSATSGDVIGDIILDIKGGFATISKNKFKIYSPNRNINDGKMSVKRAVVWNYKGQKELIIE